MKKIVIIVTLLIIFISLSSNRRKSLKEREAMHYVLQGMVNTYYSLHYRFPQTMDELLSFIDYSKQKGYSYPEIYEQEISRLKTYADCIKIVDKDDFGIYFHEDTLFYYAAHNRPFSPCEGHLFVGDDPREYIAFYRKFLSPRFFHSDGSAILFPGQIDVGFQELIKDVAKSDSVLLKRRKPFRYYEYEGDTIPLYTLWEYQRTKGLHRFCDSVTNIPSTDYCQYLERVCHRFCDSLNIERIVFLTPDYSYGVNRKDFTE